MLLYLLTYYIRKTYSHRLEPNRFKVKQFRAVRIAFMYDLIYHNNLL